LRFVSAFLFAVVLVKGAAYLEPNRGQAATDAPFVAHTAEGTLAVGPSAIQYQQRDGATAAIVFEGASGRASGQTLESVAGVSHYVHGSDPAHWLWDVPHYAAVKYANVYAGVDLVYHTAHEEVEFDFNLRPGADPRQIRLRVPADARINESGALMLSAMRVRAPRAWQMVAGKRIAIPVRFALQHGREASFQVGLYDRKAPLIIDPIVELATFLGGSNNDVGIQVQSGSDGSIYLAGNTMSADFPASLPAGDPLNRPETLLNPTAYISHLAPDASKLDWSLFIGGTAWQNAYAMRLDPFGNVYLLGGTTSPNFPVTPGAWKTSIDPSSTDYFLVKLNAQTGHVETSTFLGIANVENPYNPLAQMAIDVAGGVYIGAPRDPTGYFTPSAGALNSSLTQSEFVLRFNSSISAAVYATLWPYGTIAAMQVDPNGNIVIGGIATGCSQCGTPAFPAVNPLPGIDQNPGFPAQAYVARLNPTGTAVNFASLLQGDGRDSGITDLKIASDGSIYLFGYSSGMFPVVNPLKLELDSSLGSIMPDDSTDAPFLTRLSADAESILQSTFFFYPQYTNEDGLNMNLRMDLQPNGYPCVAGLATQVNQQTPGGLVGLPPSGFYNGWSLSCEDSTGTQLNQITDLPTSVYDGIAAAPDGSFLFTGSATNNFVTTPGVVQPNYGGAAAYQNYYAQNAIPQGDAFVLRVSLTNPTPEIQSVSPNYILVSTGNNNTCTPLLTGSGFAFGANITFNGKPVSGTFVDSGHTTLSLPCSVFQAGANDISMSLPSPGGGTSSQTITGLNAPPSSISVSPTSVTQGASATKLVIWATNLLPTSTLYWNGSPRTASYVLESGGVGIGNFELILQPSDLAQPSVAVIQVSNPAPGGGLSTSVQFSVLPTSGMGVPILDAPAAYTFGPSIPLGPTLQIGGSGFTSSTTVFWDGAQIPVSSFTATQITVQPPAADLTHWGVHQVYAVNGPFQSATVPVYIASPISASTSAYDPVQNRLYVFGSMGVYSPTRGLFALDASTGDLLNSISNILPSGQAIAVSADGQYVYLGSTGGPNAQIVRYNVSLGKVDLSWQIQPPAGLPSNGINSLVTPPDSPQTVIASTQAGDVLIFDNSQARPNDSTAQGFFSTFLQNNGGYQVFFASSSRIYAAPGYNTSLTGDTPCWMWMDYDASGISGGQTSCSGQPPETQEDNGVTYLTDGSRTFVVSVPEVPAPPSYSAPSFALDLANNKVWQVSPLFEDDYQLQEFGMKAQQFGVPAQIGVSYFPAGVLAVYAAPNGAALVVLPGAALLVPSTTITSQPESRLADWRPHRR
jgi:hypothetical protein